MHNADYHIHTNFSADSAALPEDVIEHAISLGLKEVAITDHLDFRAETLIPYPFIDLDAYTKKILELRQKYTASIKIKLGLELGLTPEIAHMTDDIIARYPFDFVICSTHDIKGIGIYYSDFYVGKTKQEAYSEYFGEMLSVVKARPDFCVYGHFDYIERYASYNSPGNPGGNSVRYADFASIADEIFSVIISQGKGIELNSSGYRYGLGHTNPQRDFLLRYKELGGEIITIGSDAHKPEQIAGSFGVARELLLDVGFRYYTVFDLMKPVMLKL